MVCSHSLNPVLSLYFPTTDGSSICFGYQNTLEFKFLYNESMLILSIVYTTLAAEVLDKEDSWLHNYILITARLAKSNMPRKREVHVIESHLWSLASSSFDSIHGMFIISTISSPTELPHSLEEGGMFFRISLTLLIFLILTTHRQYKQIYKHKHVHHLSPWLI
jgi:hypothetical protein